MADRAGSAAAGSAVVASEQKPQAPAQRPSRGFKSLKREADAESANARPTKVARIPRYGCLLPAYYPVLEALPTAALPWKPPTGLHRYQVSHAWTVPIIVNLKDERFIVHCGRRSRTFSFGLHNGVQAAWERAMNIAEEWKDAPPAPPDQPVDEPSSDEEPSSHEPRAVAGA